MPGFLHYTCFKDELLINGWTKALFNASEFKQLQMPPFYIIQLIARWFSQESIYFIKRNWDNDDRQENNHFVMNLKHILSS